MIETAKTGGLATNQAVKIEGGVKKVLHWRKNERMGGMVPVWETVAQTPQQQVADNLSRASDKPGDNSKTFKSALSYAATEQGKGQEAETYDDSDAFGFGDLIDMVNPLQHIPLVSHVYREITGDTIKPISEIIGGGVFGGPIGAAGGLINTIAEYETGKDITGNVIALAVSGETPQYRSAGAPHGSPEQELDKAVKTAEENPHDLPGSVIGFADLGQGRREVYERMPVADGRTAGTMVQKHVEIAPPVRAREPITQVTLSKWND